MGLNVELLEKSFALVAPKAQELADTFYSLLFADFPGVKPLFAKVTLPEQKKKLVASLVLVVTNLRKPDVLVPALEDLGLRHLEYGARAEHYPAVGATLLKSLAKVAGPVWNQELEKAWSDAYAEISRLMLVGANSAVAAR